MDYKNLIAEYETVLRNPTMLKVAPIYFRGTKHTSEKATIEILRYAIEYILHYSPEEAAALLNSDILEKLKLLWCVKNYITFPAGLPEAQKMRYLVHLCYPTQVRFSMKDWVLEVYKDVLAGTDNEKKTFPKHFFDGNDGRKAACVCLQYMINKYINVSSVQELYDLFNNSNKIVPLIKKYGLSTPLKKLYYDDPVTYLHYSLIDEQKDEFLFRFFEFTIAYKENERNLKNAG